MSGERVFLVTGAASGIGRHLVGRLLAQGHRITAADVRVEALDEAASADRWDEARCHRVVFDVRDHDAWREQIGAIVAREGRLDVALNVAGFLKVGRIQDVTLADVDAHIDINLKGVILGTIEAASAMIPRGGGHIVNIASLGGVAPIPGLTLYSTSKFGVRAFSLAAARDLAPDGVTVSVICPDAVETPMLTIQEDDPDAALTFSGSRPLRVDEVGDAVERVLKDRSLELLLPWSRGVLAKVANDFPRVAGVLDPLLRKIGRKAQKRRSS